ncbi:MAG: hypothetical protein PHD76_14555 [Methylacidiphilales bacterium]|nr:hypothetical protein [Candidatus Methylacidiphilales bacterium]
MPASNSELADSLRHFSDNVRKEIPALLRNYQSTTDTGAVCYIDQPGKPRRIRPWCDALEIGAAFGILPDGMTREQWISVLRGFQNPGTGLVPEYIPDDSRLNGPQSAKPQFEDRYSTMIVNYALECLGSSFAHPVANAEAIGVDLLVETLDSLDWSNGAWHAGHWIDCYASSLCVNQKYFGQGRQIDRLFSWLDSHCDPKSGVWGCWRKEDRWLHPVNGFYRLTRGTYAQFGRPLPLAEKAIDTILLHSADPEFFGAGRGNGCNILDVVHPLWLCLQQTDHRRDEARQWMLERIPLALKNWKPGWGMAFDPFASGGHEHGRTGLQGTEMWLSIIYLMADILGLAKNLSYRPNGVHRLQSACTLK